MREKAGHQPVKQEPSLYINYQLDALIIISS